MVELCRAVDCKTPCPPRHMMCTSHWAMVPTKMRQAIWAAFREAPPDGHSRHVPYLEACAKAVEKVAKLENKPPANSYRRMVDRLKEQAR